MTDEFDEIDELPVLYTTTVPVDWGDVNGHMNMRYYLALHDEAGNALFQELGFDQAYIDDQRRYFFDLEHHIRYLREVMVGDRVTVHARLLERSNKIVHLIGYVLNHRTGELSNVLESVTAHVDLETRRITALLPDAASMLDSALTQHRALSWSTPTSGAIGIKRPAP